MLVNLRIHKKLHYLLSPGCNLTVLLTLGKSSNVKVMHSVKSSKIYLLTNLTRRNGFIFSYHYNLAA